MIHIFNRKELMIMNDLGRLSNIRTILSQNNIDYVVKVRMNGLYYEYKVYVHKEDFEEADFLIHRK